MSGLASTPAQQRLTMALAGVAPTPATLASEPMSIVTWAMANSPGRDLVSDAHERDMDARRHRWLVVELGRRPRRIRELLVQRLSVADATAQEPGPGGGGDPSIERFPQETPTGRTVPGAPGPG